MPASQIPIVERLFSEQTLPGEAPRSSAPLHEFFGIPAIVVLGDPGAGKTTSFQQAAEIESNSLYVTVRDFISLRNPERYQGRTLYLDALDEMRSRSLDGRSIFDEMRGRLGELGCPRFRLSCRAADWYGSSDSTSLGVVSPDQKIVVLNLDPLSDSDIKLIISSQGFDPEDFIREASQHEIYELLKNPQTLIMIMDVVRAGSWPETRAELFKQTCEILSQEHNEEHRRSCAQGLGTSDLLMAAGRLCAVVLCSGTEGTALEEGEGNADFIPLRLIGGNSEVLDQAARRRLFRSVGSEKVVPVHRTIAEYLAALYICDCVYNGLPLKRVLALITGHDGGTLSDLRGLFAWLTCICQLHAETLIHIDPLGIILYGDASLLSLSSKRLMIERLVHLSNENPWFRSESWASRPFGALGVSEMEPVFREILEDPSQHPVALSCVLDSICYGQPMPALGDILMRIVRDTLHREFLREDALEAYMNACPDHIEKLRMLLDDVHADRVQDKHCELRALLLSRLYPSVIGPDGVVDFIIEEPESFIGKYSKWIIEELLNVTDPADIPTLIDNISERNISIDPLHRFSWSRFIGRLLQTGLNQYGETISTDRLFRWLGISFDQHGTDYLDEDHKKGIREWLEVHPDKIRALFQFWVSETPADELLRKLYRFRHRLLGVDWPEGFAQWLLDQAVAQPDDRVAFFLFTEGVHLRTYSNRPDAPTIEELYCFVERNSRFQSLLQSELYWEIPEWRWENARRQERHKREQETNRVERVRQIMENVNEVRSGTELGILIMMVRAYLGHYSYVDNNLSPFERMAYITNNECAEIAKQGFVSALLHPEILSSAVISETHAQSQRYPVIGYIVLTGMDILFERSMSEIFRLPENTIRSALTFHYAIDSDKQRDWVNSLIESRLEFVAEVLEDFWRIYLSMDCEYIPGLYLLKYSDYMYEITRRVSIRLLRDFPASRISHLENLLYSALKYANTEDLLILCREILSNSAVKGMPRVLWYATAFTLSLEEFYQKIRRFIHRSKQKARLLLSFLYTSWQERVRSPGMELQLSALYMLVSICGSVRHDGDRNTSETNDDAQLFDDYSQTMRYMINKIAADASPEACDILERLRNQRNLDVWHDALSHASALQARRRREAAFRYPTVNQVVTTLSGGLPANPADLQALIIDHLQTIREDIRYGSTDGYKAFWNVNPYSNPVSPKPEDYCRDRLLERLRERLSPLGLDAEPEGHYAQDRRSDIKVLCRGFLNFPIEIKRHYHAELWKAPAQQLRDLYARDPGAGGRGVYLVFWFGESRGRSLPKPPAGINKPLGPENLEEALRMTLPHKDRALIEVIVLDCSPSTA